jgi:predicted nucleic acid-binding Zn ribbon protein
MIQREEMADLAQQVGECIVCGKEFIKVGNKKTCSPECSKKRKTMITAISHGYSYKYKKFRCAICGKEYLAIRKNSKTCSTVCGALYQKSNRKKLYECTQEEIDNALKNREKSNIAARNCKRRSRGEIDLDENEKYNRHEKASTKVLVDINQKAREAGMSYGQYVARYGL